MEEMQDTRLTRRTDLVAESDQQNLGNLNLISIAGDVPKPASGVGSESPKVANGFSKVQASSGLEIYSNGVDFVLSFDLNGPGSMSMITGKKIGRGGHSGYGGSSPEFERLSSQQAMQKGLSSDRKSQCVFNGSYFANLQAESAQLAFPLKTGGTVISEGFAPLNKHSGKRLLLEIFENGANIRPFGSKNELMSTKSREALVSLSPQVDIDGKKDMAIGRTYIGLGKRRGDGLYEKALIFVSPKSTQLHAELSLKRFGAGPVIMLDGGGSTQLQCRGRKYIPSTRTAPHFISLESE